MGLTIAETERSPLVRTMTTLIVEDEASVRRLLRAILEKDGHEVVEAEGVIPARRAVATGRIDVVITDQELPDGTGLDVLAFCGESDSAIPVIFLTGVATVELAVDAMRAGAFDFLPKPFQPSLSVGQINRVRGPRRGGSVGRGSRSIT